MKAFATRVRGIYFRQNSLFLLLIFTLLYNMPLNPEVILILNTPKVNHFKDSLLKYIVYKTDDMRRDIRQPFKLFSRVKSGARLPNFKIDHFIIQAPRAHFAC